MADPATSFSSTLSTPPRVTCITHGVFQLPTSTGEPIIFTVPAGYMLYVGEVTPATNVGNPGDWYIWASTGGIYRKVSPISWTLVQTWGSGGSGAGTVTSVGLVMPAIFTVQDTPVTTAGDITVLLNDQSVHSFLAGPSVGLTGTPSFRSIVASDLPTIPYTGISGLGTMATQNASSVAVTGGTASGVAITGSSIDSSIIGLGTRAAGYFTDLYFNAGLHGVGASPLFNMGSTDATSGSQIALSTATAEFDFKILGASAAGTTFGVNNAGLASITTSTTAPAAFAIGTKTNIPLVIGINDIEIGRFTSTGFAVTGNITATNLSGTNTGDQTNISGNSGTATALQNTRTIGGSNFNGTANVTSFPVPGAIGGTTPSTAAFTDLVTQTIKVTTGANNGYVLTSDGAGNGSWTSPAAGLTYKGTWNASTNTPTLADGTGTNGDTYAVSAGGTQFGRTFVTGGWAIYNGSIWQAVGTSAAVTSVNSLTGSVQINPSIAGNILSVTGGTATADLSGINSATATALQTTRTIGGSNFNGSANVTSFPVPGPIGGTTPSTGAFTTVTASGTITGSNLSGTNTGDQTTISGNAGTATALQTSRTIGGSSFNGTANVTSFPAPGAIGGTTPSSGAFTTLTASSLAATGTVTGSNLSGTNTGDQTNISGNAGTATTLATGRTLAITGDLAWTSPSFNGSANVAAAGTLATVNSNVGSFTNASITVNAKGLITAASTGISFGSANIKNVRDYGAVGDGSTDDSTAVNAAIAALPASGGVLYFPASSGSYRCGTVTITGKTGLTVCGDGHGVSIIKNNASFDAGDGFGVTPGGQVINISGNCADVEVFGLTFDGNNNHRKAGQQAVVMDADRHRIHHCRVINSGEYAISTGRNHAGNLVGSIIESNLVGFNYADGININNSQDVVVSNNVVDGADDDLIAVTQSSRVTVSGNNLKAGNSLGTSWGRGIAILDQTSIVSVVGNLVQATKQSGILITRDGTANIPNKINVIGNTMNSCSLNSDHGIRVDGVIDVSLIDNCVHEQTNGNCIEIRDFTNLLIQGGQLETRQAHYCRGIHAAEDSGTMTYSPWYGLTIQDVYFAFRSASNNEAIHLNQPGTLNTVVIEGCVSNSEPAGNYIYTNNLAGVAKICNNTSIQGRSIGNGGSGLAPTLTNNN